MLFIKEIKFNKNSEKDSFIDAITDFVKENKEIETANTLEDCINAAKHSRLYDYLFDELRTVTPIESEDTKDEWIDVQLRDYSMEKAIETLMRFYSIDKISFIIVNDMTSTSALVDEYDIELSDYIKNLTNIAI